MDGSIFADDNSLVQVGQVNRKTLEKSVQLIESKKREYKQMLDRAQFLLNRAQNALQKARGALAMAQSVLGAARAAMNQARTRGGEDKYGNPLDSPGLQADIGSAKAGVETAERGVQAAEMVVNSLHSSISRIQREQQDFIRNAEHVLKDIAQLVTASDSTIHKLRESLAEYLETRYSSSDGANSYSDSSSTEAEEEDNPTYEYEPVEVTKPQVGAQILPTVSEETLESIQDVYFSDTQGRRIGLRTWVMGDKFYLRAYDLDQTDLPEFIGYGQVAQANLRIENNKLKLENLETFGRYRKAGITRPLLEKIVIIGKLAGLNEIYGIIDGYSAAKYWTQQSKNGWNIRKTNSYYGEVYKMLGGVAV